MRILHIFDHSPPCPGNYSRRVMAIVRHQRLLGWKTMHMTGPGHGLSGRGTLATRTEAASSDDWQYFRTSWPAGASGRLPVLGLVNLITRRLQQVVQMTRPRLLHVHSPVELAFAALRVGHRHGLPVVFEVHAPAPFSPDGSGWMRPRHLDASSPGPGRWGRAAAFPLAQDTSRLARLTMRALEAWAAQRAESVVTNSDGMCARLRNGGVTPGRISLIPDGLEPTRYPLALPFANAWHANHKPGHGRERRSRADRPARADMFDRRSTARSEQRPHVVLGFAPASKGDCAGSSASLAALKLLLAAMEALDRGGLAMQLLVACDAGQDATVLRLAEQHGMGARVAMMSDQAETAFGVPPVHGCSLLAALHARVDIVVFAQSATNMATAPPCQLLEAMARGCIIAAARSPEHEAVIEHGRNGVLFAPGDRAALADALRVLVDGASRWPGMRTSARWFIDYHRSWEVCVAQYKPIYERLLSGQRRH